MRRRAAAAVLPCPAVVAGMSITPHSLIMLTALQPLWNLAAAWTLWQAARP